MFRLQRTMAVGAVLAVAGCAAPAPPELLTADGVERVSVDHAAYGAERATFRDSALALGDALLADGGQGNVIASPGSLLIALAMLHRRRILPVPAGLYPGRYHQRGVRLQGGPISPPLRCLSSLPSATG